MSGDVEAARERMDAAEAEMSALTRRTLAVSEEYLAASEQYQRLRVLSMPLREALMERLDPAIQCRKAVSVSRASGWVHRGQGEVRAELDALVGEGLIRKVGNCYVSLNPRSVGGAA